MNTPLQGSPSLSKEPALQTRLLDYLPPISTLGPFIALVVASLFFASQTDRFFSGQNFSLILQQVMIVGVIALGQTLIILTAGIDLSCGMVMALGSVVMSKFAVDLGIDPYLAIACGMLVCTAIGALNGSLVTRIKLPAFIVTLGTMNIAFALTQIYSGAQTVTDVPEAMMFFGNTFQLGQTSVTYGTVLMIGLYILTWLFLRDTAPGRHVYAVGNNPESARLTGIATGKVLIGVYMVAGLFYGIASMLSVARMGVGDPQAGATDNLDSITAVVIGGTSLFGGRGSIVGTLIGVLIVGVFRNGLTLMGVPSVYQVLVTGILVILAVATDQLTHKKG